MNDRIRAIHGDSREVLKPRRVAVTVAECREVVGKHYRIPKETMLGPSRKRKIARPRMMVMALARELTAVASYPRIGAQLGGRDHTTVIHGVRRISQLEAQRPAVRTDMDNFRLTLLTYKFQKEAETV